MTRSAGAAREHSEIFSRRADVNHASHPATCKLMEIARRIGQFQAMHYKLVFNRERPSQLSPALLPPSSAGMRRSRAGTRPNPISSPCVRPRNARCSEHTAAPDLGSDSASSSATTRLPFGTDGAKDRPKQRSTWAALPLRQRCRQDIGT